MAGGVLTPSAAGSHIIHLGSRLVVGVRLHGTIAAPNPRNPTHLKSRPFLRYFAETLRRLRCDVTLFSPIASRTGAQHLAQLNEHHFLCRYRIVHDPTLGTGLRRSSGVTRANFQDYLIDIAAQQQTSASRVLFIDSEVSYRFTPTQTLVLEAFEPQRIRQRRGSSSSQERRVAEDYNENSKNQKNVSAVLAAEQRWAQQQQEPHAHNRPFATEMAMEQPPNISMNTNTNSSTADRETMSEAVREAALAINREDFTLVALAGMLVELAASEASVSDYLRVEPLVEKLTVPFHGQVNYLPVENCDDMEQWDWDAVEVQEAMRKETAAANAVPDVEEREEHRNLFK